MKNAFLSRHSVDSHSTLVRGSFLASFAKRFAAFAFVMLFAIPQMWGALTSTHVPGIYEKAVADGGFGIDLTTYNNEKYEVYYFVGNDKYGTKEGGADQNQFRITTLDSNSEYVLCSDANNGATYWSKNIGWLETNFVSSGFAKSDYAFGSNKFSEFFQITPNGGNTKLTKTAQFKPKSDDSFSLKVSGYTEFAWYGKDNGSSKYVKVVVDGKDEYTWKSNTESRRSVPLTTGEHTIVFGCVGGSQNVVYGFSLKVSSGSSVTYNANGATDGSVPTDEAKYANNATVTVKGNTGSLKKTGYNFDGWNTKADGTGATFAAGTGTFKITQDTTLYAKWTAKTYDITLDKNGGSADGSATVVYDGGVTSYTPATPASAGQTLLGYFDAETGGNKIIDALGGLVADKWIIDVKEPPLTLFAQWASSCTVRFMANGEVFDTQTVGLGGNATTPEGTPEAPTGKGFGGWSETDGGAAVDVESITINGDKDFYAVWKDLRTVSFATGCGSAIDPVTVIDGQPVAKPTDPTRTNWEITKWQLEGADYNFDSPVTSDIELTAVWQRKTISGSTEDITVSDGTTLNSNGKLSVGYGKTTSSYATGNGGIRFTNGISSSTVGTNYITFMVPANYTASIKTITAYNNGAVIVTNSNTDISSPLYDSSDPKAVTFTEGTYYVGRKGDGSVYLTKLVITLTSAPITATFKDGEVVKHTVSATANEELGNLFLDCELPVLENHDGMTFLGWYNGESQATKATTISASTTYTAKWQGEEHTLTWTIGEGTIKTPGTPAGQVEAGTPLTAPVVEREGYRFDGWNPEVPNVMPNDDAEYVAQWVKVFNVTYMDGETELGKEIVDEGQKAANYAQYQNQSLKDFKGWSDGENSINFATKTIDADLVAYGSWDIAYAQSVDFMAAAHTNPQPAVADFLAVNNYAVIPYGDVQWDTNPYDHRDCGLKFESKTDDREFAFWVSANRKVSIQIGSWQGYENESMPSVGTAELYMNGTKAEDIQAEAVNKYYTTEDTKFVIKVVDPYWSVIQKITIEDKPIVSDDVSLKDLTVNGVTIEGFAKNKTAYNVALPYKTTSAVVAATPNDEKATVSDISQATSLPGIASFTVTAEDGITTADYTVNFTIAPKDGICLIKGQVTGQNAVTITVGEGTGAANNVKNTSTHEGQTGYKLSSRPAYIGITLAEGNFQAGDVVNVFVTSVAVGNDGSNPVYQPMRVFSNNTTDDLASCLLVEGESNMVQGVNTVVLPEGCNTNTIYLCRGGADKTYDGWNPYIAYIEVLRPMNPMLTAISFNGVAGVIDDANKTITATLPFTTDFSAIEVTESFISNDNSQVTKNYPETWIVGDNVISLTDKDGDYTEYTVTLSRAEASHDATLKSLKVGEDAITLVEDAYAYTYEYAYGASVPNNVTAEATSEVVKSVEITQATSETKLASILVTAEDETTQQEYTITFTEAAKPAETPTITTQPASHDYNDTEVIVPLTVVATISDEGTLSYQWYKDDEVIEEAIEDSYTPTEAGDYKVVVTNTLGTKTASVTSNVATITITHIYTFASWDGSSINFEKKDKDGVLEFTVYSTTSGGKHNSKTAFKSEQTVDRTDQTIKANVLQASYFAIKFAKDATQVKLHAYNGNTGRALNSVKVSSDVDLTNPTYVDAGFTITNKTRATDYDYEYVVDGNFESGKYYFFTLSNSVSTFDVFYTEAPCEEPEITAAPAKSAKKNVEITLSVEASGTSKRYQWYTCEDAEGTNPVEIAGATNATCVVTKDAEKEVEYFKVVVFNSCGTDEAVVKLNLLPDDVPFTPVSESMTWNFASSGAVDAEVSGEKGVYLVLANVAGVKADLGGQYMAADFSKITTKNIQATGIKIHTTVPGRITITFAQTGGDKVRELYINNVATGATPDGTTNMVYSQIVEAGDIVLTAWEASTSKWQMFNYATITFTAATKIRDGLTNGKLVTMCQAQPIAKMWGGAAFDVEKPYSVGIVCLEAEMPLTAGKPYILYAEAPEIYVLYGEGDAVAEVVEANGLVGNLNTAEDNLMLPDGGDTYIFQNNHLYSASGSNGNYVAPDRAYLNYSAVTDQTVDAAPSRRRLSMGGIERGTATGLYEMMSADGITKFIRNNQLYILRDGKLFNAQGAKMR